jgi:hypothetical protein
MMEKSEGDARRQDEAIAAQHRADRDLVDEPELAAWRAIRRAAAARRLGKSSPRAVELPTPLLAVLGGLRFLDEDFPPIDDPEPDPVDL